MKTKKDAFTLIADRYRATGMSNEKAVLKAHEEMVKCGVKPTSTGTIDRASFEFAMKEARAEELAELVTDFESKGSDNYTAERKARAVATLRDIKQGPSRFTLDFEFQHAGPKPLPANSPLVPVTMGVEASGVDLAKWRETHGTRKVLMTSAEAERDRRGAA